MRKRKRASRQPVVPYPEQQLAGLREYTQAQKQRTVDRLAAAITSLAERHKPISARTIYEECGLEYASIRRNPEALLLYQQHSTFLKRKRKRGKTPISGTPSPRDPLMARLRKEQTRQAELETQYAALLQDYVQRDVKIAELEAELAQYREYFEKLRITVQQQEHRDQ